MMCPTTKPFALKRECLRVDCGNHHIKSPLWLSSESTGYQTKMGLIDTKIA